MSSDRQEWLETLQEDIRHLDAFAAVGRFLHARKLRSSQGVLKLADKLSQHLSDADSGLSEADIVSMYQELRCYGRKALKVVQLTPYQRDFVNLVRSHKLPASPTNAFAQTFPKALRDQALLKSLRDTPLLASVCEREDYLELVFCCGREYEQKEDLDPALLKDEAPEEVKRADSLVWRRHFFVQAFDLVLIDLSRSVAIFAVDGTRYKSTLPQDVQFRELKHAFADLFCLPELHATLWEIDLFPAIKAIYDDELEGYVTELAFLCSTGVTRTEKKYRKSEKLDIRKELYHKSGKEALPEGNISAHKLTVQWDRKNNDEIFSTLSLNGSRAHADAQANLFVAEIEEPLFRDEFLFSLYRLQEKLVASRSATSERISKSAQFYEQPSHRLLNQFGFSPSRPAIFDAVISLFLKTKSSRIGFGVLLSSVPGSLQVTAPELLACVQHMSSPSIGLTSVSFELIAQDGSDTSELHPEVIKEAYSLGYMIDPNTGDKIQDFEDRVALVVSRGPRFGKSWEVVPK